MFLLLLLIVSAAVDISLLLLLLLLMFLLLLFSVANYLHTGDIVDLLKGFRLGPPVIQAAVNTLCLICSALSTKQKYQASYENLM